MQQSPIFSKTYDLMTWLIPATTKFPREQRFVLARHVQEAALRFQEDLIEAGMGRGKTQVRALARAKAVFYWVLCLLSYFLFAIPHYSCRML